MSHAKVRKGIHAHLEIGEEKENKPDLEKNGRGKKKSHMQKGSTNKLEKKKGNKGLASGL